MRIVREEIKILNYKLSKIIFYFLIYSFIGWCIEVSYVSIIKGHFTNRGFLLGPFCCIYGFGALLIVIFLKRYKYNPILLFISAAIITTILEYFTGYFMEKAFSKRWWDYSDQPLNIVGRVCLRNSIIWGVIAVAAVYFIHPFIRYAIIEFLRTAKPFIIYFIIIYFVSDFVISSITESNMNAYTGKIHIILQEVKSFLRNIQDVTLKSIGSIRNEIL